MGVSLYPRKYGIANECDMGYFTFNRLREDIADIFDPVFSRHYKKLSKPEYMFCLNQEERDKLYRAWEEEADDIIKRRRLSVRVVSFLMQPDCEGKIGYGTCKMIYNLIANFDDNKPYGYTGRDDCTKVKDIKNLLMACYHNKCDMFWH